ncbi:MAG: preprotein translocase subunit SecG [Bacteroidia bacterium]
MGWIVGIWIFLLVIACLLLVLAVLIQKSKGGGLATNLQGVSQVSQILGVRQAADFIERATWWLFGIIIALTILIQVTYQIAQQDSRPRLRVESALENAPITAPTTLPNPADLQKNPTTK